MALSPNVVVVNPGELITAQHLNNVRANLDRLDTTKLSLTGGTMTGTLYLDEPQSLALTAAVSIGHAQDTYVNVIGDTMTGPLYIQGTQSLAATAAVTIGHAQATYMNVAGDTMTGPLLLESPQSTNTDAAISYGYAQSAYVNVTGDTMSGDLIVGTNPITPGNAGFRGFADGRAISQVGTPVAGSPNIIVNRMDGGASANDQAYVHFRRTNAGTVIGSITIATTSSVAYNTTSDPRTKTQAGTRGISDAAARAQALGRTAWRGHHLDVETGETSGEECDLLSSHDIEDVAAYAVTGGRDDVDEDGNPAYQQVSYPDLVPLLFAALANALDRIDALEGAAA